MLFNISKVTPPLNNKYVVKDLDPKRKNQKEQSVTSQSASGQQPPPFCLASIRTFDAPESQKITQEKCANRS